MVYSVYKYFLSSSNYLDVDAWLVRYEARPVAVKVILPYRTCEASPECKEKFQREVMLLSKIRHENVVEV